MFLLHLKVRRSRKKSLPRVTLKLDDFIPTRNTNSCSILENVNLRSGPQISIEHIKSEVAEEGYPQDAFHEEPFVNDLPLDTEKEDCKVFLEEDQGRIFDCPSYFKPLSNL